MTIRFVLVLLLYSGAFNVIADDIRPAWLQLTETSSDGTFDLVWKQAVIQGKKVQIEPVFPEVCTNLGKTSYERTDEWLIKRSRLSCGHEDDAEREVRIDGLEHTMISVFVRLVQADGRVKSFIVKPAEPVFTFNWGAIDREASDSLTYFQFGMEHLLAGYDHVLFIIGLVLLVRIPVKLIQVVTSFTLAHSLTLGLSTLGLVSVSQNVIEAIIALSIVFLAVELVRSQDENVSLLLKYPWAMTFVLGLLHGFGFAGALTEIGLPQETILLALLLFNIGVEIGQLIIVAMVLAVLFSGRFIKPSILTRVRSVPAYLIGSIASFWLIQRSLILF